ncbi:LOW QUALITY PROTEIN: hypothetical protein CVT26_009116 [Gymnopilus dilepis]|uniref:Uncharacterized protein n=1 Tax=Gymnopilus dilepis TaxID=231916 RepID=A0A409Y9F3_9AGAR|nr:LOW QUALITY PROTEIN: hypothetical protein CVT26_009116 [Gymnopilus dilepis]
MALSSSSHLLMVFAAANSYHLSSVYIPAIYIDFISIEELDLLYKIPMSVPISSREWLNVDELIQKMWETLNLVHVYTKPQGLPPDYLPLSSSGHNLEAPCKAGEDRAAARSHRKDAKPSWLASIGRPPAFCRPPQQEAVLARLWRPRAANTVSPTFGLPLGLRSTQPLARRSHPPSFRRVHPSAGSRQFKGTSAPPTLFRSCSQADNLNVSILETGKARKGTVQSGGVIKKSSASNKDREKDNYSASAKSRLSASSHTHTESSSASSTSLSTTTSLTSSLSSAKASTPGLASLGLKSGERGQGRRGRSSHPASRRGCSGPCGELAVQLELEEFGQFCGFGAEGAQGVEGGGAGGLG